MNKFFTVLGLIAFAVAMIVFGGWVTQQLWGWFVVPQFHLAKIGVAEAAGLCLVGEALSNYTVIDDDPKTRGIRLAVSVVRWVAILVIGYVVHLYV